MINLKHLLILTALILCGIPATAQNNDFEKIAEFPNVHYVYISKSMLKSMELPDDDDELNFLHSSKELNSVEMLSCEDAGTLPNVRESLSQATDGFELLSKVKSNHKNINIYGKRKGDGLSHILVISSTPEKVVAAFITGHMDAETLKSIAEMKQSDNSN